MRVPPRTQTGNLGASEVTAAFERINWGVADNSRHDVGTDLLVMARDERGVELCLLVGVQVKTRGVGEGPGRYFREPVKGLFDLEWARRVSPFGASARWGPVAT